MKQSIVLTGLLCSLGCAAQEVKPVLSDDYLRLIQKDSSSIIESRTDTTNSLRNAHFHSPSSINFPEGYRIKKIIRNSGGSLYLVPSGSRIVRMGGSFSIVTEFRHINRTPSLQNEYVQGRSSNGALVWRGPETGELFSYGPSIHLLEFDGSDYPYDINGKLVNRGSGNGNHITGYDNSILRNGGSVSHSAVFFLRYRNTRFTDILTATIKTGHSTEQTPVRFNKNKADNFSATIELTPSRTIIGAAFIYGQQHSSYSNRNGFLNRVYQNSLLSPVSFSNRQGYVNGDLQRSYSADADNPFFLLAGKNKGCLQQQQTAKLSVQRRAGNFSFSSAQFFETLKQDSREGYQPHTAFFPSGAGGPRNSRDDNYQLNANAEYRYSPSYRTRVRLISNYIFNNNRSSIGYPAENRYYRYQRSTHDLAFSVAPEIMAKSEYGGVFTYKLYTSNTLRRNSYFLPAVSAFVQFYNAGLKYSTIKISGSFSRYDNELPINRSLSSYCQLQLPVADNLRYFPLLEISHFNGLDPIRHREYSVWLEWGYKNSGLSFNWFDRQTKDDIFPQLRNGSLELVNMANHRDRGIEIILTLDAGLWHPKKASFSNVISFVSNRNKVTAVKDNYDNTPLAGFADVHKTLLLGAPLGVITGSTWKRNADGDVIIGNEGFPLVNNSSSVIGNPFPDFTMKMWNRLSYKNKWELAISWEWKKGNEIWNGTQAMLDYYGRSALSGDQRNTMQYIFPGISANGQPNTIPVNFYDPYLPLQQNRWVRYGSAGVAEAYIQKGDQLRINTITISYKPGVKKPLQQLTLTLFANNILVGSPYHGSDTDQLLNDQPPASGLDLFNLPSVRSVGFNVSLQF